MLNRRSTNAAVGLDLGMRPSVLADTGCDEPSLSSCVLSSLVIDIVIYVVATVTRRASHILPQQLVLDWK